MKGIKISDGEAVPFEELPATLKVVIMKPEGPIKWEGYDEHGNYGRIYVNGAETWISREILEDDRDLNSPGI